MRAGSKIIQRCVKSVQIQSFFWFAFGLNTEIYGVKYGEIQTRKNSFSRSARYELIDAVKG